MVGKGCGVPFFVEKDGNVGFPRGWYLSFFIAVPEEQIKEGMELRRHVFEDRVGDFV
jgi:hypothetical protein